MKTKGTIHTRASEFGYALLLVMGLAIVATILLTGTLKWAGQNGVITARNNEYFTTAYAAEAATEKAFIAISRDYQNYGEGLVYSKLNTYASLIPVGTEGAYWSNYNFSSSAGASKTVLQRINPTNWIVLGPPYQGLQSMAATYQIIAGASKANSPYGIQASVAQEINLGTIPIFQFAIFYQDDLEINPGAPMTVQGVVHGNSDLYMQPSGVPLTFTGDVSGSGTIYQTKKAGDPVGRSQGTVTFQGYHFSDVTPLNLPVGTNTSLNSGNVDANVHAILDIPPAGEAPNSTAGTNRYYNKADMILILSNNTVIAQGGVKLDTSVTIPASEWSTFLNTNVTFFNKRENLNVQGVSLDVGRLRTWSQTNASLRPHLPGGDVATIYIADQRNTTTLSVVSNVVISTNYTQITNTTPTVSLTYPAAGTYVGSVNNTTYPTNSTTAPLSPPAINVVTNTTSTSSSSLPGAGTYVPPITTNTTTKSSNTYPTAGTYVPPVTTNMTGYKYTYKQITGYTYNKITGYSFSLPAYAYNKVTGIVTNASYLTNVYYTSNYVAFAESGVVLTNGSTLPSRGLTVATPNPVYVDGNYNTSADGVHFTTGSSNTSNTRPAAIAADAITILSTAWNPVNSSNSISYRVAADTTVNAAFLAGNVQTAGGYYSGGVENFPRFLENWSGKTITYNGSMVVMFSSRIAVAPWGGSDVYSPPNRNWTFDNNFKDPTKLPPSTPQVISVTRGRWSLVGPNTSSF